MSFTPKLRLGILVSLVLACGPDSSSTSDAASASATSDDVEAATMTSEVDSTGTTAAETTTPSDASSGQTIEEPVEYVGFYDTGFGFPYFYPCGLDEPWTAEDLPGYELCASAPLFLRVRGTTSTGENGSTRIEISEILEGPCTGGSCDGAEPVAECGSFDAFCLP